MATETSRLIIELLDRVSEPARRVASSLSGITRSTRENNQTPLSFSERLDGALARNKRSLANARTGMLDAAAGFYALRAAITGPMEAAMGFEDAMADVTKVVDFESPEALADFEQSLKNLSREIPTAVNGLANIAAAAGQAGIAGDDLIQFTDAAARIGVAFDISAGQAGDSMAKLKTALGLSVDEVVLLADSFNHLSNQQASTAAEITDFMLRTAATAQTYGFAATESAAFGSAMIASGAEANVAATSFRNMGRALTKGASATKRQAGAFKSLGLDSVDVAARMQEDAVGTTLDILERIKALPAEVQAVTISNLFGDEARALGPLMRDLDLIRESLGYVADESAFDGSAFDEAERRMQTFSGSLQTFKNQITEIGIALGESLMPVLTGVMENLRPILTAVAEWVAANPDLAGTIFAVTSAVIGLRVAISAFRYLGLLGQGGVLHLIRAGLMAFDSTVGVLSRAAAENIAYQSSLAKLSGTQITGLGKITAGLKGIAGVTGLTAAKGAIMGVVGAIGAISAPVWLGVAAAVAAIAAAWKYWDRISAIVSGVASAIGDALQPALDWVKDTFPIIEPIIDGIASAFSAFGDAIASVWQGIKDLFSGGLFKQEDLGADEFAAIEARAKEVATAIIDTLKSAFNDFIDWVTYIPRQIIEAIGSIDLSSIIQWPEPPAWWSKLFGGDEPTSELQAALDTIDEITGSGPLPTDDAIARLRAEREALEARIAAVEAREATNRKATQDKNAELRALRADLESVEEKLADTEARAEELRAALQTVDEQSASPEIITDSIDEAMATVARLEAALNRINAARSAPSGGQAPIDGARAAGGPITRGGRYLVGERGPELITAQRDGYVHPHGQAAAATGATVHFAPQFTFHNTRAEDAEQIASQMRDVMRSEVREAFRGVFADTSMRFA